MAPRSGGMSRADVIALQHQYGSTAALVRSFGIPEGDKSGYLAARRAVERVITATGKEQHKTLSPKYSAKARASEKIIKAAHRNKAPKSIRVKARFMVVTDTRRDKRGDLGTPGRWVGMRGTPTADDVEKLAANPAEFWADEFGADLEGFDIEDVEFEWGED